MQISDIKVHTIIFTIQFIASELLAKSLAIFQQNCISMYLLQNRHLKRHFIQKKKKILIIIIIKSILIIIRFFSFSDFCVSFCSNLYQCSGIRLYAKLSTGIGQKSMASTVGISPPGRRVLHIGRK